VSRAGGTRRKHARGDRREKKRDSESRAPKNGFRQEFTGRRGWREEGELGERWGITREDRSLAWLVIRRVERPGKG